MADIDRGELPILPSSVKGARDAEILIVDATSVADAAVSAQLMIAADQMITRVVEFTDGQYLVILRRRATNSGSARATG